MSGYVCDTSRLVLDGSSIGGEHGAVSITPGEPLARHKEGV